MSDHLNLDLGITLLDRIWRSYKPLHEMTFDEIKLANETPLPSILRWLLLGKPQTVAHIKEQEIPTRQGKIPLRLYYPNDQLPLPLIIYFHGGGWVTGSLDTHDVICRRIAHENKVLVASVGYRLAPLYPYPQPPQDSYDATVWLADHRDLLGVGNQILVMGDSVGGNLATVVCLMARDLGKPLILSQILIYPALDGTLSNISHQKYADAPFLNHQLIRFFVKCYSTSSEDLRQPYFSPLLANNLRDLPPALILTAEYDPLHDDGEFYAQRLLDAGVTVESHNYQGMIHGFLSFPRFCAATNQAFKDIQVYLQSHLGC